MNRINRQPVAERVTVLVCANHAAEVMYIIVLSATCDTELLHKAICGVLSGTRCLTPFVKRHLMMPRLQGAKYAIGLASVRWSPGGEGSIDQARSQADSLYVALCD